MALPSLLYGSEAWTHATSKLKRIETVEMKLLRLLANNTHYVRIRYEEIHKALKILTISETIKKYQNNWHEPILRIQNLILPMRLFKYTRIFCWVGHIDRI